MNPIDKLKQIHSDLGNFIREIETPPCLLYTGGGAQISPVRLFDEVKRGRIKRFELPHGMFVCVNRPQVPRAVQDNQKSFERIGVPHLRSLVSCRWDLVHGSNFDPSWIEVGHAGHSMSRVVDELERFGWKVNAPFSQTFPYYPTIDFQSRQIFFGEDQKARLQNASWKKHITSLVAKQVNQPDHAGLLFTFQKPQQFKQPHDPTTPVLLEHLFSVHKSIDRLVTLANGRLAYDWPTTTVEEWFDSHVKKFWLLERQLLPGKLIVLDLIGFGLEPYQYIHQMSDANRMWSELSAMATRADYVLFNPDAKPASNRHPVPNRFKTHVLSRPQLKILDARELRS